MTKVVYRLGTVERVVRPNPGKRTPGLAPAAKSGGTAAAPDQPSLRRVVDELRAGNYRGQRQLPKAERAAIAALELARKEGDVAGMLEQLDVLSEFHLVVEDLGNAAIYARRLRALASKHNKHDLLLRAVERLEIVSEGNGQLDAASGYALEWLEAARSANNHLAQISALLTLASLGCKMW
nr:hypothetical protein HK105_001286 [Polyrhizophydium stewartii]